MTAFYPDRGAKVDLSGLPNLGQNHGWDLLGRKLLLLPLVIHHDHWEILLTHNDFEWPGFDVCLNRLIAESVTNQSLHI
jgi:hypothetical protein